MSEGAFRTAGMVVSAVLAAAIVLAAVALFLSPNPPMDPDGGREDSGRGGRELQAR